MQQKEVLIIVGVLLIGFVFLKSTHLSNQASNTISGFATISGFDTISCPDPHVLTEVCANNGYTTSYGLLCYGDPRPPPGVWGVNCNGEGYLWEYTCDIDSCNLCMEGACSRLEQKCYEYCNNLAPGEQGPSACTSSMPCTTAMGCTSYGGGTSQCYTTGSKLGLCECAPAITNE